METHYLNGNTNYPNTKYMLSGLSSLSEYTYIIETPNMRYPGYAYQKIRYPVYLNRKTIYPNEKYRFSGLSTLSAYKKYVIRVENRRYPGYPNIKNKLSGIFE